MSKTSKQTTESAPPKWAEPLLKKGAGAAMDLYDQGKGYTPYSGETRAGFSDPSLSGMNSALAATGYKGPAVSNDTWKQNSAVQNAKKLIEQLMAKQAALPDMPKMNSGYQPTENEMYRIKLGADPKLVLGDNYDSWANGTMTQGQYYSQSHTKPEREGGNGANGSGRGDTGRR